MTQRVMLNPGLTPGQACFSIPCPKTRFRIKFGMTYWVMLNLFQHPQYQHRIPKQVRNDFMSKTKPCPQSTPIPYLRRREGRNFTPVWFFYELGWVVRRDTDRMFLYPSPWTLIVKRTLMYNVTFKFHTWIYQKTPLLFLSEFLLDFGKHLFRSD